jgi:hypothetical protein
VVDEVLAGLGGGGEGGAVGAGDGAAGATSNSFPLRLIWRVEREYRLVRGIWGVALTTAFCDYLSAALMTTAQTCLLPDDSLVAC